MEEKMNENIIEDTANQQENSAEDLSNSENINNSETNDNKVSQSEGLKRYEKILDLKEVEGGGNIKIYSAFSLHFYGFMKNEEKMIKWK